MNLPESVLQGVREALAEEMGRVPEIVGSAPVRGGCINPSAKLEVEGGELFFLKWNSTAPPDMFEAEADGLRALSAPGTLRVPRVLGQGGSGTSNEPGWLLLEFVPQGRPAPDFGPRLGEGLAALHASPRQGSAPVGDLLFGWHRNNFIGSLPQDNTTGEDWTVFWRERRLEPQLRMARERGHFTGRRGDTLDRLLLRLDEIMRGARGEGPALLHGDLWSGNYYAGPSGEPVLIDPAVYRGRGEVDLAMMELFGSLPRGFEEGYGGEEGLAPEYSAFRRDLYQLYYLLVHVNLFGGGYVGGSLAAAERVLRGT